MPPPASSFCTNLPTGARLREVEARPGDLDDIRERIKAVKIEIAKVERIPVPSDDIADRVKRHVDALAAKATPIITGVGSGQALKVLFPLHDSMPTASPRAASRLTKATRCC